MRTISSIKWTDESIEHIARHAVRPEEVEEVCFNEEEIPFIRSGRENLHYVFGKTYSGRFLFVVVRFIRQRGGQGDYGKRYERVGEDLFEDKRQITMKKIPTFKTEEDAARFWEGDSFQDYYRDTKEAGIKFVRRAKEDCCSEA